MAVDIGYVQKLTSPHQFALVSARTPDGTTNLMALSWWTFVSNNPPAIAICLSKKGYTGELIRNSGEFGLCTVNERIKHAAFLCGSCSGRNENKSEKFGIELRDPAVIATKLVKESGVALECRLLDKLDVSDHSIYVAEVVHTRCNPEEKQAFAFEGYKRLDTV